MKFFRFVIVACFFLLSALPSKGITTMYCLPFTEYDIAQSPLSDDETNASDINIDEIAEFDFDESDESNTSAPVSKFISFEEFSAHFKTAISVVIINSNQQNFNFSDLHHSPSYLQVFLI